MVVTLQLSIAYNSKKGSKNQLDDILLYRYTQYIDTPSLDYIIYNIYCCNMIYTSGNIFAHHRYTSTVLCVLVLTHYLN